jgi:regulator of protease activity HflC (stomatin/prohibitin superfamily)
MIAHPESLDGKPPPKHYRWWRFVERRLPIIVIYLMVVTLIGFVIAPSIMVTVPSGHVGLLWKRFRGGTQLDARFLKEEGLRILLPWDKLFLYDLRLQTTTDTYNAISKDGVNLMATINIRFRLKHDSIPQLHQGIGPEYLSRLVRPEIGNRMREIIAEYSAEEVYSTKRQEIQKRIRTHTEAMLSQGTMERTREQSEYGEHYRVTLDAMLNLYDTLILGLELPQPVVAAINRKIEQYYLVQEYAFRVEREKKESERKQIEADGVRAFQTTVSQGISDSYVRWRGIEATLQLAQSNNAKIVIIGSGKDGLPIILGNVDSPSQPRTGGTPGPETPPSAETTTGASPPPLEKIPSTNLTKPSEKPPTTAPATNTAPPAGTGTPAQNPPAAAPGKQSATTPDQQKSSWPFSMADIQALFFGTSSVSGSRPAAPVAMQPQPSSTPKPQ